MQAWARHRECLGQVQTQHILAHHQDVRPSFKRAVLINPFVLETGTPIRLMLFVQYNARCARALSDLGGRRPFEVAEPLQMCTSGNAGAMLLPVK